MSTNRRRHANAIPVASFAMWGVIALFVLGGGLAYVWCKNQIYTAGTEIKELERQLAELGNKNEVAASKIAQLLSTAKIQERFDSGFINLIPITGDRMIVVAEKPLASSVEELRPAANERIAP